MSRPFSYNDENFTVIGNLLICHIVITKSIKSGANIVEVPSEIYKRLLYTTNSFIRVRDILDSLEAYDTSIGITYNSGKYYLFTNKDISASSYKYLLGCYCLKDI